MLVARADDTNCQKRSFWLKIHQTGEPVWRLGSAWTRWGAYSSCPHPLAALRGWGAGRKRRGKRKGGGKGREMEGKLTVMEISYFGPSVGEQSVYQWVCDAKCELRPAAETWRPTLNLRKHALQLILMWQTIYCEKSSVRCTENTVIQLKQVALIFSWENTCT